MYISIYSDMYINAPRKKTKHRWFSHGPPAFFFRHEDFGVQEPHGWSVGSGPSAFLPTLPSGRSPGGALVILQMATVIGETLAILYGDDE